MIATVRYQEWKMLSMKNLRYNFKFYFVPTKCYIAFFFFFPGFMPMYTKSARWKLRLPTSGLLTSIFLNLYIVFLLLNCIYTWWVLNLQPQLPPILGGGGSDTFSKALWLLNNLYLISYSLERKLDNSNKQFKVTIFGNTA